MEGTPSQENVPVQALQFIKAELSRTQKSITELQSERRLLRKQLSRWTGAVQVLQESQEDVHCRLEAKIEALTESSECLRTELHQLRQNVQNGQKDSDAASKQQIKWHPGDFTSLYKQISQTKPLKAMHQPSKLKEECIKMPPACDSIILDESNLFQEGNLIKGFPSFQSSQSATQSEKDSLRTQNGETLAHMRHLCESIKAVSRHKTQEGNENPSCLKNESLRPVKGNVAPREDVDNSQLLKRTETSPMMKEEELQALVKKLKDALSIHIHPGHLPGPKQELLHTAGQVCTSYSTLLNKVIQATSK
ncbi:dystrotelin isoform X1 [Xenopus laevis]|uniref:Dystrotelin isoform X1 n=1 Tax=Xenopus laevis TaxID=8355 RepID=A0A8J0TY64_XENLA|nr:dystrotelin isoform X1 [Xenopus laevis]